MGGVCEEVGQYGTQQGEGDLLSVQAEDAVEQLCHPISPLLSGLLQQLLKKDTVLQLQTSSNLTDCCGNDGVALGKL